MRRLILFLLLLAGAGTTTPGCRREPTAADAVAALEQTFPRDAAAVSGAAGDALRIALAAARTNDLAGSVIALQGAKSVRGLDAAQLEAIENASLAITSDLVRRADSGDPAARESLKSIERSRSQ